MQGWSNGGHFDKPKGTSIQSKTPARAVAHWKCGFKSHALHYACEEALFPRRSPKLFGVAMPARRPSVLDVSQEMFAEELFCEF